MCYFIRQIILVVIVIPAGLQKGSQPAEWCVESSFCALGALRAPKAQSCLSAFLFLHAKNDSASFCVNATKTRTLYLHKVKKVPGALDNSSFAALRGITILLRRPSYNRGVVWNICLAPEISNFSGGLDNNNLGLAGGVWLLRPPPGVEMPISTLQVYPHWWP